MSLHTHYLNTERVFLYVFLTAQAEFEKNCEILGLCDNRRDARAAASTARPSDYPTQDYRPERQRQDVV